MVRGKGESAGAQVDLTVEEVKAFIAKAECKEDWIAR